jgi:hypothetical protein
MPAAARADARLRRSATAARARAARAAHAAAYALVAFAALLRELWLAWALRARGAAATAWRRLPPALRAALGGGSAAAAARAPPRGSAPRRPAVLAAVVGERHQGARDDQAVCRLLLWARAAGVRAALLYDPWGALAARAAEVEACLRFADPGREVRLWRGWRPPPGVDLAAELRAEPPGALLVALLTPADAERPLEGAAAAAEAEAEAEAAGGAPPPGGAGGGLARALAAPAELRERLAAAGGAAAALEPDLVLVFGPALSLAGFPPWAARTAELFELGALGGVTGGKLDAVAARYARTRQRFGR